MSGEGTTLNRPIVGCSQPEMCNHSEKDERLYMEDRLERDIREMERMSWSGGRGIASENCGDYESRRQGRGRTGGNQSGWKVP